MAANGSIMEQSDVGELLNKSQGDGTLTKVPEADTQHLDDAPTASMTAKDLTTKALQFLSNASNEALCACFAALGLLTYFILGRLGLLLIGGVGGVVLHAIWEDGGSQHTEEASQGLQERKRREKSLDVVRRVLDLRNTKEDSKQETDRLLTDTNTTKSLDFADFKPDSKAALEEFTNAVLRDYVSWWYSPILPKDQSFPAACRQVLTRFLLAISNRIARKRPADVFLDFVTNSSSILIVFLNELANALKSVPGADPLDAVEQYTSQNPSCSLANVLDLEQQEKKLKGISDDILQNFLDLRTYSCEPVKAFLREALAGLVLEMTVVSCSRADFINEWIIYALEDGETTELVQAIDAGVTGAATNQTVISSAATKAAKDGTNMLEQGSKSNAKHQRSMSRAEEAMEDAMTEARRLTELIAEQEAQKQPTSSQHGSLEEIQETESPLHEKSPIDLALEPSSSKGESHADQPHVEDGQSIEPSFTTFDQIVSSTPTALQDDRKLGPTQTAPLTLHNATVSIFDDSAPGEKATIKSKPNIEYLLQIEPASSQHPGWMIPRKFSDFETLHEVLRRISVISGVTIFADRHQTLPVWKNKSKASLRVDLERYLQDALSFQPLAESEGMRRFLDKDQGMGKSSPGNTKGGLNAFETMGKGMLDVLSAAPKGAAGGGKVIVGGVAGVLGGIGSLGQKKATPSNQLERESKTRDQSLNGKIPNGDSLRQSSPVSRTSTDLQRTISNNDTMYEHGSRTSVESVEPPPLPKRHSHDLLGAKAEGAPPDHTIPEAENTNLDVDEKAKISNAEDELTALKLPPPPSEMTDDYSTVKSSPKPSLDDTLSIRTSMSTNPPSLTPLTQPITENSSKSPHILSTTSTAATATTTTIQPTPSSDTNKTKKPAQTPLSLPETTVAIELFFATITELYSLSSAWSFRLTLLSAAKTYLLRPSNPNLESIRDLLQSTLIEPYTSDEGIASLIRKTRENALPTEDELKSWPDPNAGGEQARQTREEDRRRKARKLLMERGMPTALTGVMGQTASAEALGKVFDCLQSEKVARGLVFAIVLQAVRAVTQ